MNSGIPVDTLRKSAVGSLLQIEGVEPEEKWVPSRFNARTDAPDGKLILYNSYSGAFSVFPTAIKPTVESYLHKDGFRSRATGVVRYLRDGGFIVRDDTNELSRLRHRYGAGQYRKDLLELILLTSEECNFRCVYCYETFPRGTMEPWVREAVVSLVEKRAPSIQSLSIGYFGGEPLLGYEAIEEVAPLLQECAQRHDLRFSSGMTTNAYLLTPDRFERLVGWGINSYQITVDGTPENHDAHRPLKGGGPTFEVIHRNLVEMRKTSLDFRVAIRVNFDNTNVKSMPEFLSEMQEFKSDERFAFRFYAIGKWGGPNDKALDVCGVDSESVRQQLDVVTAQQGFKTESRLPYIQGANVCYAARPYHMIVGADGKLMKCTVALDQADYNIVGNITKDGRADMDLDRLLKWITPYYEDDDGCKSCFFVPVCQGCSCPIPRIKSGDRPCPDEKLEIRNTLESIYASKTPRAVYDVKRGERRSFDSFV